MHGRPRVAFVVQRCGAGVIGGAERLCLETAAHMAEFWDVEILTTCAADNVTWENVFTPGLSHEGPVPLRRFSVDRERDRARLARLSKKIAGRPVEASEADQLAWLDAQGPRCEGLGAYLREHGDSFDAVYFYSYLYGTTYENIESVAAKAVLVSLAHDEWMLRLPVWERVFASVREIVCLTPEEEHLVASRFSALALPTRIVAVGVEDGPPVEILDKYRGESAFALYVGRVDPAKNCDELIGDYIELAKRDASVPELVLVGPVLMPLPDHPRLIVCGPLSTSQKRRALASAAFVVIPSEFESLSLVALESWAQGKAVLVNGSSSVLVGQCRRSGGGLWYGNRSEFSTLYAGRLQGQAKTLGRQGKAYVEREYAWPNVTMRHRDVLASVASTVPR